MKVTNVKFIDRETGEMVLKLIWKKKIGGQDESIFTFARRLVNVFYGG